MEKKNLIAVGLATALLFAGSTAFADSDKNDGDHGLRIGAFIGLGNNAELKAKWHDDKDGAREDRDNIKAEIKSRFDFGKDNHDDDNDGDDDRTSVRGTLSAVNGTTLTLSGSDGTVYTVLAADAEVKGGVLADIKAGDSVMVSGELTGTTLTAHKIIDLTLWKTIMDERMSHFTKGIVTNVTGSVFTIDPRGEKDVTTVTTDANTIFKVNGEVATSGALAVGSKVFLSGTTTASSTAADAFSASVVHIFTEGMKHLKRWFWFN